MTEFPIKANTQPAEQSIDRLIAALRKAGKEAGMAEKEIEDLVHQTNEARSKGVPNINSLNTGFNNLGKTVGNVAKGVVALIAIDKIKQFAAEIIKVTSEFQRFEAVLTNTLGSNSSAQIALRRIQDFAQKTPFSVRELTDSFVRLANQGFRPTVEEMRKLGDLASSTGKNFDQLAEAIIDAQTGEFERLKEFGIRAKKEGDNVTFTFKGVQTQTEFTAEAMRNYVLSLGDAVGVSGSMSAISETLGGRISNLGDSFTRLLNTLGDQQSGPLQNGISNVTYLLDLLNVSVRTNAQVIEQDQIKAQEQAVVQLEQMAEMTGNLAKSAQGLLNINNTRIDALRAEIRQLDIMTDSGERRNNEIVTEIEKIKSVNQAIRDYVENAEAENQVRSNAQAAATRAKRLQEIEAETKAREKLNEKLREYLQLNLTDPANEFQSDVNTLGVVNPRNASGNETLMGFLFGKELDSLGNEATATPTEDPNKQALKKEEEHQEAIRDMREQTKQYSIMAIQEVFRSRALGIQNELSMLQMAYQTEIKLAGNNEIAKQQISSRFDAQRAKLLEKQVVQEQQAALFTSLINIGPGIAKTIATVGLPTAFPLIAAVGAMIGLQMANIRKAQAPRFAATGEFNIDGPGTETSDSIPYFLSKHESVVHAKGTKKFGDILKPMIDDPSLSWADVRSIVDMNLPDTTKPVIVIDKGKSWEEISLLQDQNKLLKQLVKKPSQRVNIDRQGFSVWMQEQLTWTNYLNKRYGS